MVKYVGKAASSGSAYGEAVVIRNNDIPVRRIEVEDEQAECEKFDKARSATKDDITLLHQNTLSSLGESAALVFEIYKSLLDDVELVASVNRKINEEKVNAAYAVASVRDYYDSLFSAMDDEYLRARCADIRDVTNRVIRYLVDMEAEISPFLSPAIIVADELSPSEFVRIDREMILGVVTKDGSAYSHTAILCKMMGIPYISVKDIELEKVVSGMEIIVDCENEIVIFEPTEEMTKTVKEKSDSELKVRKSLEKLKGKGAVTKSGKQISILANISSPADAELVIQNDAEGIGLFRSEFLYMMRDSLPTEDEQFEEYRKVVLALAGKKVIIRTMDIGSDKAANYLNLDAEANPALGCRAIRLCLNNPDIFKTQLRALFRAAAYGNLSIMYPMITSKYEIECINELTREIEAELNAEGVSYRIPEQGIMIETPAAALISDELAEYVDFFSIGTNDLTQYSLAIDRQNGNLDRFYDPHHKAILKMIKMVTDNSHVRGKWTGICGELAADTELTKDFIRMGVDELSVAPGMVLPLRKVVRNLE